VRAAQRASRGETGRARIGFASSAGFGILPDAVRRFRLQYPDVELVLLECNSNEQIDLLSSGAIDVGLLHPPHSTEPALELETLLVIPLLVALPEGHPLANHRQIALEALKDEPWIFFPRAVASRLYDEIIRACTEAGFARLARHGTGGARPVHRSRSSSNKSGEDTCGNWSFSIT
jgi:DNA-binding transcriptional LysR family regulator